MTYTCIIIEDENILADIIERYLSSFDEINLIGKFEGPIQAIKCLETKKVDLIVLDIEMPLLNGIDFAKTISEKTSIIFTTAYSEYALQGFELNALDYLLKPITFERFVKSINRFITHKKKHEQVNEAEQNQFIVKSEGAYHKIEIESLIYIESLSEYLKYHLATKSHIVYGSLAKAEENLKKFGFIRVHKSFVVSKSHILSISSNQICLSNNTKIPIGRKYKKELQQDFFS